jgi:hypothetical protein
MIFDSVTVLCDKVTLDVAASAILHSKAMIFKIKKEKEKGSKRMIKYNS